MKIKYDYDYDDEERRIDYTEISGETVDIKAIAKSIYRALGKGLLDWAGFTDCPRFNPERSYHLLLVRDGNARYCLYATPET